MIQTASNTQVLGRARGRGSGAGRAPLSVAFPGIGHRSWSTAANTLSVLGVGCARAGSIRNQTPVCEIGRMLSRALDHGVNLIDTADIYGQGDSERIVARAVNGRRDDAFIVTKIGFQFRGLSPLHRLLKPGLRLASRYSVTVNRRLEQTRNSVMSQDFEPDRLMMALEGSLRRLRVSEVDGLMLHNPSVDVLADDRVLEFLVKAKSQGKIRHYGASVVSELEASAALGMPGLELLQVDTATARRLASEMQNRAIALIVRQVLTPPDPSGTGPRATIDQALPAALAIPHVTSATVGLSSCAHLQAAIDAVS